jgi:hypothetical protein
MNTHSYVLLATYPGSTIVHLITGADNKHIVASEENLPILHNLAQKLLNENIISTAQIFKAHSEVMVQHSDIGEYVQEHPCE